MKRNIVFIAGLLILSSQAMAQSGMTRAGFYAGLDFGFADVKNYTSETSSALVRAVGGSASVSQDATVQLGRLFGGYKFNENIGLELGYVQTGNAGMKVSGVAGNSVAYTGTGSASISGADYSLILRPNISSGMNGLFLRLGGHSLTGKANATLTGTTASGSSSISGDGTLAGIGFDMPINNSVGFRVGYTAYYKLAGSSDSSNVVTVGIVSRF